MAPVYTEYMDAQSDVHKWQVTGRNEEGGVTSSHKPCTYVLPHGVLSLSRLGLKTGVDST